MTAPIQSTGRPKSGYHLASGEKIPGVTSIVSRFKDSGGLMFWAFEQGKKGAHRLYDDREKQADIGTFAHDLVFADLHKLPAPVSPLDPDGTAKALTAFGAYRAWAQMVKLDVIATEMPMVDEQLRFGGTPDAIGRVLDALVLLDWKTSNGIYAEYLIQMAAYKHLWELHHPDQPITGGFHLLRFAKEHGDFAHHHFPNLAEAWRAFVLMRELYEIDKQLSKRAK